MAALTARGAPAGACAMPSESTVAVAPGASVVWVWAATPPFVAASAAGASATRSMNDASASARVRYDSTSTLFRRPAELADGLARKEPAPSTDHRGISPNNLGPPLSGTSGD